MKTIGIEACQTGWFAISLDNENAGFWLLETHNELEQILTEYDRIFIDIPIGLSSDRRMRECDRLLRKKLGDVSKASVLNPPIRPALHAPTYGEASMISYEATDKKISIRSWNITPNIRTIDQFLHSNESYRNKMYESHPEFLFQILNGGNFIFQNKATKKGLRHRLGLLKKESKYADDFFRDIKETYRRNQVDEDDIVDAMVLALFSLRSLKNSIKTLPEDPPKDKTGLPMAVHYV